MGRKTKFQPAWLDRIDTNGDKVLDYISKKDEHHASCKICDKTIFIGNAGFYALKQHAERNCHKFKANDFFRRSNQRLIQFQQLDEAVRKHWFYPRWFER